jgi:hypothetical protein
VTEAGLLLPEGSLLLHIGPPKTGSSAIQRVMHESRPLLAEHGVLYPGTSLRDREASWAVLGATPAVGRAPARPERWQALVDEVRGTDLPRVFLSHENFARADEAAVGRILEGLGRDRTHVVYVARRIDRLLPSHWHERVKAWETMSYEEYLREMLADERGPLADHIWGRHDVDRVLRHWASAVGPDRFTIVVSDERDRSLIPRTFEAMLGLPAGLLDPPAEGSNASLSYTDTEVLRALNQRARAAGWTPQEYWHVVQKGIVRRLRERSDAGGSRIEGLPPWAAEPVMRLAERQIAQIRDSGVRVIGDTEVLRVTEQMVADLPPGVESVPVDLLLDVVQGAVDGAAELRRRELRSLRRKLRRSTASVEPSTTDLLRQLARRTTARLGLRR